MVVDGNFVFSKHIVQLEQVVVGHEMHWEHQAMACQERLKVFVFGVRVVVVLQFDCVPVLLCVPEAIMEVAQVPLREVMLHEELADFEWPVINDW